MMAVPGGIVHMEASRSSSKLTTPDLHVALIAYLSRKRKPNKVYREGFLLEPYDQSSHGTVN